jgi:tetratricopeptide (TPR) repeat protein
MPLDREKTFQNAERLLKQGKISQALEECRRLADDAPKDLLMLNRLGDFLSRSNRGADAIVYYLMIVDNFAGSGFYPKAIAILKKIVKVDPNHLSSVVRLGELNLKQKLPGEARTWFLQAAEAYLRAREFGSAREVYEKLVAAEPDNFVYLVRLAEARAADGDPERAGLELVAFGVRMLAGGKTDDAQRTFQRAAEFLPGRAEPMVGLARCHAAAGARDEALGLADQALAAGLGKTGKDTVASEVFVLFEQLGDASRSERLLAESRSDAITDESIDLAFRAALSRGQVDGLWTRVTPLLQRWTAGRQFDRAARLLEHVARIEDGGHVRALEQLVELRKAEGNRATTARAIERLVRACQAKGRTEDVAAHLQDLKTFDPTSPVLFIGRVGSAATPAAAETAATSPDAKTASVYEVPAVPIAPADHEFVSGNLTEAEVFEKYGLLREALQQLRQLTARFPGHVVAQEKLVGFLRTQSDRGALRDGLCALALAKRASGDTEGARKAAIEATSIGGMERSMREVLERFALVAAESAPQQPTPAAPAAAPAAKAKAAPSAPITRAEEDEMEILFDEVDDAAPVPASESAAGQDLFEEIEFYLGQGMAQDALSRIAEARKNGQSGEALDALEARARGGQPAAGIPVADDDLPLGEDKLDEEDLSSITAALEAEYGTDRVPETPETAAEPESEQSVDEVFAEFKEHVSAAVDSGDFRTHYDLGIAYKEMGLVDDALAEFLIATQAPELYREACSMLGLCHWERGDAEEAIRWYRSAIDAPGADEAPLFGLRYELAEMLEKTGDMRGAYDLLVLVSADEPGYRDVDRRVAALRGQLGL